MKDNNIGIKITFENIIGVRNLKGEFIEILNDQLYTPIKINSFGDVKLNELYSKLYDLFASFNLTDLKFKLIGDIDRQKIIIEGIREIDKLAINGILAMEDI